MGGPIEQVGSDGTVLYYYQDQLGSTRGLLNGAGQTVATSTSTYDPYGNLTASTGSVRTPFGFAGQYTDAEAGLQYLQARSYDPVTMQFMSADPLHDLTAQPYAYAAGNPLSMLDPTGLGACKGAS